ncbi:carbon-nitrogen hydrolase family protein [Sphingomicrobium clamense]|uniref:Carbon-nitrogen hydrolase family protein n=1 Tax=Sphingomicrobium clamense TaxID=2851013 RepID=A0ABS6V7E4_9SPHN|nr:carbon-nitrogen hydrolase family protein [Sphingomicrobium sp. B8]MBW0145500.1 carbon-nitrogen hydrolase family protein [Sphingomicrobium sp. B8]
MPRIALFQATSGIDPDKNAEALVGAVEEAAAGGAQMLFTPEMSGLLDGDAKRASQSVVDEADDRVLAAVREAAARAGIWVHLGSLAVKDEGDKFLNRAFVIDDQGKVRGRYDKIHLFDVDLPTGESWRESNVYQGGAATTLVEGTPVGALGLTICYDLRFPALFAALAESGADTIAVPAAFTVPTGKAHWHVLLRARAIEAGLFLVAAAQVGKHEDGRETFGHSLVVDPWGEVLCDAGEKRGVTFCEVELERIAEVRSRVPALSHRKTIAPPRR